MKNITKYTTGSMSTEELDGFTNQFLNAKFDTEKRSRWNKILNEKHDVSRNQPIQKQKIRKLYVWAAAVAAAILLFLVVQPVFIQQFSSPSPAQLATNFIDQNFYDYQEIARGNEDVAQLKLDAIAAYNTKNFPLAIKHWESIISNDAAEKSTYFFLGLSYLNTKKYTKAIINLQKVETFKENSKYEEETQWFLALAYIENNNLDKAKTRLETIVQKEQWNNKKAKQLLDILDF